MQTLEDRAEQTGNISSNVVGDKSQAGCKLSPLTSHSHLCHILVMPSRRLEPNSADSLYVLQSEPERILVQSTYDDSPFKQCSACS